MGIGRIRLLLIEDSAISARIVAQALWASTLAEFEVVTADRLAVGLKNLGGSLFDLVILDLGLPDSDGLGGLEAVRLQAPTTPVIVMTATDDDRTGMRAVEEGAEEFLVKDHMAPQVLGRTILNMLTRQRRESLDELTGLANRRGFAAQAKQMLHQAERREHGLTLLFIDIDDMKGINDAHGHLEGDRALIDTAHVMRQCFRGADLLARMGGDEFCVLAEGTEARNAIGRLQRLLDQHNQEVERPYLLSVSCGAYVHEPGETLARLIEAADARMYEHKRKAKRHHLTTSPRAGLEV